MTTKSGVATVLMVVATPALIALATRMGTLGLAGAFVVAAGLLGLAVLGRAGMAVVVLGLAFATAPMYRGIGSVGPVTPTDAFLLIGLVLLLPSLFDRSLSLPPGFLLAIVALTVIGLVSSANNASPVIALVYLIQWLVVFAGLPVFLVMWGPSRKVIDGLLACYVAGQVASIGKAFLTGPIAAGRYMGFSHHPNDFGLAGGVAVVILLYLLPHCKEAWLRVAVLGLIALNLYSVIMSGSRGVTLAVAVVVVLIPIAERSGVWALLLTFAGAIGLALLPLVVKFGGSGGAFARLAGDQTSAGSDSLRSTALGDGWKRLLHSPFLGSGLDPTVGDYHNLFLEVPIAFGIFGLAAYLVICYVFARPLFTRHPLHRLSYLTWLFLIVGVTFPGINDRTIAVPLSMAILAAVPAVASRSADVRPAAEPVPGGVR
jgi:hypothetical protein